MRRSPPCAAPAGDVRRKHSSRRHGRAPGPHAQPELTGSLCLRRPAQERHGLGAAELDAGPQIKRGAVHHPYRCMPEPPYWTAQKYLVDRLSPLTCSGTVGKSAGDRRGGWPGCSISTRCTWFSRRPRRGWPWIDYSRQPRWRQVGARAPAARVPPLSSPSLAHPRVGLCQPLPLHARASDGARAGTKGAPDPDLHAAAARAASRPRRRRRGRLERGRLATLPWRPTDGWLPGRVV